MFKAIKEFLFGSPAATVQPVVKEPYDPGVDASPTKQPRKKRTFVKRTEGTASAKPKAAPAKPKAAPQAKPKAQPAAATAQKPNNRRRKPKDWSVK